MKRKILHIALCAVLSLSLAACGKSGETYGDRDQSENIVSQGEQTETGIGSVFPEIPAEEQPEEQTPPASTHPIVPEIPAEEQPDTLLASTTDGLNVRSGAGTKYDIVGTLDKNDMVMPIRKADNWYEIQYKGGVAYISASYVSEVSFKKGSDEVERVISEGKKLLGIPYVFGAQRYLFGNGTLNKNYDGKSYDCSSLMQYIFKIGANVNLAMTSREQSLQGTEIAKENIKRGDLLFFTNASRYNNTGLERIGHVALYLGDNIILHTASDHAVIEPMSATRRSYYITARRVL